VSPRRYFATVNFAPIPYNFKPTKCEHLYKNTNVGMCNKCGRPTHDIDWDKEKDLKKEHVDKNGFFYNNSSGWWSI
jgi:hypothetical protein